jgi:conjugative relaxase-like TrwC/TraI family protein
MRMMGSDSVEYHEHSVALRGDDPVVAAAAYYASRGETPMTWGGSGRALLGLDGEVDLVDYRAIFGVGGAHHPGSGARLVACRRPGLELVVSPHKSVAELGVIGRAEEMHAIVDAERDATLEYLDRLVAERGGRRGRGQLRTPTGGLVWATSRHATTRAGDPQVHDHVLIANAVWMLDERGGWKGADTALLRDHLHAATAIGRLAAAHKAVGLGYGIVADPGPSGRLGGWAIAGIPEEVCAIHSKRSAQISEAVGDNASYASRSVAARATRERKADIPVSDLLAGWRAELVAAGHPPAELLAAVDAAGAAYQRDEVDLERLAGELLAPGGRLAREKTFALADVIVATAPHLHGLPPSLLDEAVTAVLGHADAVRLPLVSGSREEVWAARCILADETRVAELAELLAGGEGPKVADDQARTAVTAVEERIGVPLTVAQREVATGLLTGGHRFDVVVGVAGSGKTTTLAAVRAGFESAGYEVVGTATSGQAARNLAQGAGMESRTVASLAWRLEHGCLALSDRHVVVLDEGGMTPDVDLLRLLTAVERSGAKLVVVGDDRQLGAVGPGGALRALADRHPGHVFTLGDNLRQRERAERGALAELRDGDVRVAVSWYARSGRVHAVPDRRHAVRAMVRAWAKDLDAGRDTLLLAYRRENVEALNAAARQLWERAGRLTGPELVAPGGRTYRAGDRVVTLAPGPKGAWVTSEPARVTAVDPEAQTLTAVTPDGRDLCMGPEETGADRLDRGYAVTAHRSQGATVDAAHVLDDGGGRELAYVAMSRARHASHVYTAAGDLRDAAERLAWSWDQERRDRWASDRQRAAEHIEALRAERRRLVAMVPTDVSAQLARVRQQQAWLERDLADLRAGAGRWRNTPVGNARYQLLRAHAAHRQAQLRTEEPGFLGRRRARQDVEACIARVEESERALRRASEPHAHGLSQQQAALADEARQLEGRQQARAMYIDANPDVFERIAELDRAIEAAGAADRRSRTAALGRPLQHAPLRPVAVAHEPPAAPEPSLPFGPGI